MEVLAAVGGGAFLLVCLVGGARLLWLARRTRALPELVLGSALFGMGGIGVPLAALARVPIGLSPTVQATLLVAQCLIMAAGMAGIGVFQWRVFRPTSRWAAALALVPPILQLVCVVAIPLTSGFAAALRDEGLAIQLYAVWMLLPLGWSGWESIAGSRMLWRRVALGLAEPVVADRMRLWGVAMSIGTVLCAMAACDQFVGLDVLGTVYGMALIGPLGLVGAASVYLAFLPPASYTRWVAARSGAGA